MSDGAADRIANVSGAVLLGGASQRMGSDKAHLLVEGRSVAARTAELLARLFADVVLVGGEPPDDAPGRRVADPDGPQCALRGLVGALESARAPRVLVVATDLPRLTPELLLGLVAWPEADVVAPHDGTRLQPLCALYRCEAVLPAARAQLDASRLALQALLEAVETRALAAEDLKVLDPDGLALANANTPADWSRLAPR